MSVGEWSGPFRVIITEHTVIYIDLGIVILFYLFASMNSRVDRQLFSFNVIYSCTCGLWKGGGGVS